MLFRYGFGILEDRLIDALARFSPKFDEEEKLITQGADVNALSKNSDEDNVLSNILEALAFDHNDEKSVAETAAQVIRFFLEHGFDMHKDCGRFGAQYYAIWR